MKTLVDARLRDEARRFELRLACEDCAHFCPEQGGCTHGYPKRVERGLDGAEELEFCKEFELV
ncbi:MAG: hypothetical protein M3020_18020 [Myxococcota bacterium]|nr:hypothetical protein [Myxococcota bacterium]